MCSFGKKAGNRSFKKQLSHKPGYVFLSYVKFIILNLHTLFPNINMEGKQLQNTYARVMFLVFYVYQVEVNTFLEYLV